MATPEHIATLAQQGEAMGFGIIAVTDHIIFPKSIQSAYPGSGSGQYYAAGESQGEYLEALALLSFLAGLTSSAKLLTAVMVLPNRPPILTAKSRRSRGYHGGTNLAQVGRKADRAHIAAGASVVAA